MLRRHFLTTSAAAAIAPLLPASPPERKWRVAVLGDSNHGKYGHSLDSMWLRLPEVEIVAVADPNPKGLEATLRKLNVTTGFADYREIAQVKPDIVAVCPAMSLHRDMALVAAASGARGIYMEKPFCRSLAEADDIVNACEKHEVKLALAHRNRWHPTLPVVGRLVKEGAIGRLLEIRGRGKEDRRGGLEDLWILGSHVLNLATYFTGKPTACSAEILLDSRPVTPADVIRTKEDFGAIAGNAVHARFETESGVSIYFDSVQDAGDAKVGFGLQLIGTKGIIDIRVDNTPLAHLLPGNPFQPVAEPRAWVPISAAGVGEPEPNAKIGNIVMSHEQGARDLIAAIQENRQPLCSAADGRLTVEMVTAVMLSHVRGGKRLEFPLEQPENPFAAWS